MLERRLWPWACRGSNVVPIVIAGEAANTVIPLALGKLGGIEVPILLALPTRKATVILRRISLEIVVGRYIILFSVRGIKVLMFCSRRGGVRTI